MNSIIYLGKSFIQYLIEFFRHWYIGSSKTYWNFIMNKFEQIDYIFALKITLRNIFKPLYKDYSFIGHILGFIFRLARIILSSLIYTALFVVAATIYILWLLLPLILILKTFTTSNVF